MTIDGQLIVPIQREFTGISKQVSASSDDRSFWEQCPIVLHDVWYERLDVYHFGERLQKDKKKTILAIGDNFQLFATHSLQLSKNKTCSPSTLT